MTVDSPVRVGAVHVADHQRPGPRRARRWNCRQVRRVRQHRAVSDEDGQRKAPDDLAWPLVVTTGVNRRHVHPGLRCLWLRWSVAGVISPPRRSSVRDSRRRARAGDSARARPKPHSAGDGGSTETIATRSHRPGRRPAQDRQLRRKNRRQLAERCDRSQQTAGHPDLVGDHAGRFWSRPFAGL
jgi:hypothetical protein